MPATLISISRPPLHGISCSLPDLDPQSSDTSETFSEFHKKIRMIEESKKEAELLKNTTKKGSGKASRKKSLNETAGEPSTSKETKSIIELLHERYLNSKRLKAKRFLPSKLTKSTPAKNEDSSSGKPETTSNVKGDSIKKNIFETSILKTRTRTENKNLKCKESLREVFGVDDRPSSAPPTFEEPEPEKLVSFDQKYREYLEGMNVDFGERPKKSLANKKQEKIATPVAIKVEKMDEDSNQINEEDDDDNETVRSMATTIKDENWERDLVTPTPITSLKLKAKKGRGIRTGRRKGSSGFDYIRKKKKPTQNTSENSIGNIIRKRMAAMENLQEKDENDISKEIKGWVLNKGVGESALHKAARLGYIVSTLTKTLM